MERRSLFFGSGYFALFSICSSHDTNPSLSQDGTLQAYDVGIYGGACTELGNSLRIRRQRPKRVVSCVRRTLYSFVWAEMPAAWMVSLGPGLAALDFRPWSLRIRNNEGKGDAGLSDGILIGAGPGREKREETPARTALGDEGICSFRFAGPFVVYAPWKTVRGGDIAL